MAAINVSGKELRRVVIAASVGNIIEWYDFYIFGSLASILAVKFFEKSHPVAAFLSTVAIFSVGFLIRPLGAFLFGWLGDKVGRKYTFIVTLTGMGVGTAFIGMVPTYASIGLAAAFILFALRLIQGLCLGGEYGGAITYVAEHIEDKHRGYYTGWLQTSPTLGIVLSLAVIIGTRTYLGEAAFNEWGWRFPFILSLLLVGIAIWIRLSLGETPIFQDIKARGRTATNPWREAFMSSNFKYVVIASVVVLGQGAVWYSGQFWALFYLQSVKKLDVLTSSYIIAIALLIATPTLIFWGWLSDKVGRKPIILGGMLLASLTYYPLYTALGVHADPKTLNFSDVGPHRGDPGQLRGHDLRPDRGVPGGVLPLAHPLHLGIGAVPYRQRLGRRSRAHRHHSGLRQGGGGRLQRSPLLGPALSHRGSRDHVPDRHLRDAGDAQEQHLGGRGDPGRAGSRSRLGARFVSGAWTEQPGQSTGRPSGCKRNAWGGK